MQREGVHIITSGTTATINNGAGSVFIDPASTLTTLTLTLPSAPSDQDIITILFGGTLTAGTVVTLFTLSPNSGQTILGTALSATAALFSSCFRFQYRRSNTTWYRIQ